MFFHPISRLALLTSDGPVAVEITPPLASSQRTRVSAPSPMTPASGLRLGMMIQVEKRYFLPPTTAMGASVAQAGRSGSEAVAAAAGLGAHTKLPELPSQS